MVPSTVTRKAIEMGDFSSSEYDTPHSGDDTTVSACRHTIPLLL